MFRIWANRVLKEFIIKGYVMDDARLREPENFFGKDYFEEQLERIRDIRASERRFYQKITDIYSQCSADYDVESPITKEFFATVQNKLHYAVTHHTAAEIVYGRADSTKPNMGLTTWKNAPKGRIRKSDVTVAKNYLNETEMRNLNEIVTMYLDYAERRPAVEMSCIWPIGSSGLTHFYSSTRKIFCMIRQGDRRYCQSLCRERV